jgi:hypothetical protein
LASGFALLVSAWPREIIDLPPRMVPLIMQEPQPPAWGRGA